MRPPFTSARKVRPAAVLLVLVAHAPLVLLFLWGWRVSKDEPEQDLVFFSLWPSMREAAESKPATSARSSAAPDTDSPRQRAPTPAPSPTTPSTAIAAPEVSTEATEPTGPSIDWRAAAAAAAARQAAPAPSGEFSAAPKALRKPCEKPRSSWEWNEQPKKAGLAPLPYVVLGRCVVGLGFFGCALQKPPEANSHLLDDMRDGKTSPSSVPDADRCD